MADVNDTGRLALLAELEDELEHHRKGSEEALVEIERQELYRDAGYASFDAYCRERWGDRWVKLVPTQLRRDLVAKKRSEGKSLRTIGDELGIDPMTAHSDLATVESPTVPNRIMGKDGKERPATRQQIQHRKKGDPDYKKRHIRFNEVFDNAILGLNGLAEALEIADLEKIDLTPERLDAMRAVVNRLRRFGVKLNAQAKRDSNGCSTEDQT